MTVNPIKLLLIEDNPLDQDLFQEYLEDVDIPINNLIVKDSIKKGLKELRKNETNILLLDCFLPDSDGMEGYLKIRKDHPGLLIIMMTGVNDIDVAINAIKMGAQDYLIKGHFDSFLLEKSLLFAIERNKLTVAIKNTKNQLEIALKEAYDYKAALDASSIVAITDTNGIITYVNDKFCEISEYTEKELIGSSHNIINSNYHNKDFWENLWSIIEKGKVWQGEIRNKSKSNENYWVDTTIVPFLEDKNKPYQYLAIRKDITMQKKIEQDIMNSIIASEEQVRENVSENLHDGLAQTLTGLKYHIKDIESKIKVIKDDNLEESVKLIKKYIHQSIKNSRTLAIDLMPQSMKKGGLIPSITDFINNIGLKTTIEFNHNIGDKKIDKAIEITTYRSIVLIIERINASNNSNKITIEITNEVHFEVKIDVHGFTEFAMESNVLKDAELLKVQKRIELKGGLLMIKQDQKKDHLNILIKYES